MANTFVQVMVHIVFHTKSNGSLVRSADLDRVHRYIGGIIKGTGCILIEIGGRPDHVHALVSLSKNITLADLMRTIKAESSKWIKTIDRYYTGFAWQAGYGAFAVCASMIPKTVEYIRNQEEHHRVKSFREEYKQFLIANGIEFDERYI